MFWMNLKGLFSGVLRRENKSSGNQIWCVVANVVNEHVVGESREIRRGTKHFSPGAKVYCFPPLWGDGYENIKVIGHHRGSHKLVTMVMPSKWLENWRVKMVYSPQIIRRMKEHWDDSKTSEETAVKIVEGLKGRPQK
jgi:hypothetical protein